MYIQVCYYSYKKHINFSCFLLVYVLISLLTTAIFCRMLYKILTQIILGLFFFTGIINAVLTTLTIVLLSVYTGIHFYIRFVLFHNHRNDDFYTITVR